MKMPTLLIVDDMPFDRKLLAKALALKISCKILEAESGEEALKHLETDVVDLVLLDIDMPTMSGDEVLLELAINCFNRTP